MPTNPLVPIHTPAFFAFSQGQVLEVVFGLVFFIWALYTLILAYHWIRYGHRSWIGIPAIIIHLLVSGALFLMAVSGFA